MGGGSAIHSERHKAAKSGVESRLGLGTADETAIHRPFRRVGLFAHREKLVLEHVAYLASTWLKRLACRSSLLVMWSV